MLLNCVRISLWKNNWCKPNRYSDLLNSVKHTRWIHTSYHSLVFEQDLNRLGHCTYICVCTRALTITMTWNLHATVQLLYAPHVNNLFLFICGKYVNNKYVRLITPNYLLLSIIGMFSQPPHLHRFTLSTSTSWLFDKNKIL